MTTLVEVLLRNPKDHSDTLTYYIEPLDNPLAQAWVKALKDDLINLPDFTIEKNFCFLGCPNEHRDIAFLCSELNKYARAINDFFKTAYVISDHYSPETVVQPNLFAEHGILNRLHNHFEKLQGTVGNMSEYYNQANNPTKFAIRQLNLICHELENQIILQRKLKLDPDWLKPCQITSYPRATKHPLTLLHKQEFVKNKYDRRFGYVYLHWAHIGKTHYEVFRDEQAPQFSQTVCEAITNTNVYTGEFDVEWGRDIIDDPKCPWHQTEMRNFESWCQSWNMDINDPELCLGYAPLGQVLLEKSFGTTDPKIIWDKLFKHLDIGAITLDSVTREFKYSAYTTDLYSLYAPTLYN